VTKIVVTAGLLPLTRTTTNVHTSLSTSKEKSSALIKRRKPRMSPQRCCASEKGPGFNLGRIPSPNTGTSALQPYSYT